MKRWNTNRPKVAKPRLPQSGRFLPKLFKPSVPGVKKPTIKKLWLVSLLLWLLCVSMVVALLFWRDPSWLEGHRLLGGALLLGSLALAIVLPMGWRIFVVWDGQDAVAIGDSERSHYERETVTQKNLDALAAYLAEQHPFGGAKHQRIMAVSGEVTAFADVGEQLARVGWAKTDDVYWVLVNDLDEITAFPRWRGAHQSPFDGLLLLCAQGAAADWAERSQWLHAFYQRLNWQLPFLCVARSQQPLLSQASRPVIDWLDGQSPLGSGLKAKVYDYCSVGFLRNHDQAFLRLNLACEDDPTQLEAVLPPEQLRWCQGVALQAQQADWWARYAEVAARLGQVRPRMVVRPLKFTAYRLLQACLWGMLAAIVLSFTVNFKQATKVGALIDQVAQAEGHDDALKRVLALQQEVAVLGHQTQPMYARLGFSHRQILHDHAIEVYGNTVRASLLTPIDAQIKVVLQSLQDPALSPAAGKGNAATQHANEIALAEGFDALKAYLMLREPQRVEAIFLSDYLLQLSQALSPTNRTATAQVLAFYSRNLADYPHWALGLDQDLVAQSRQRLSQLVGAQAQDEQLYQQIIEAAQPRYADLSLTGLLGQDGAGYWTNKGVVPGVFTRAAWDGGIRQAIEKINPEHYKNGSWVLTGGVAEAKTDIRKQIMQRYKQDHLLAWQGFLNQLRWVPPQGLTQQTERVKKYADKTQSVLYRLLLGVQHQAQIGFEEDRDAEGKGVLLAFKPLTDLLVPTVVDKNNSMTELGAYQEKLLVLYLEMQKIQGSSNQEAASQNMFNALLSQKNTPNALSEVEQAIALQVANLGETWQEAGKILFDVPFLASKDMILAPAIQNLNGQWQAQVVTQWQQRFGQQYPFVGSAQTDVSVAELSQFVDPQQGLIAQFIQKYLGNTLMLVGTQWQPNPEVTDQLRFSPEFLTQINQLTETVAFLQPSAGKPPLEMMFMPAAGIQKISLNAAGQTHDYFNEQPFWQKIPYVGPAQGNQSASLQWLNHEGGSGRIEFLGDLSFLRLLDQAALSRDADGSVTLRWSVAGTAISMKLKNNQAYGFMGLLRLKNQTFPSTLFEN